MSKNEDSKCIICEKTVTEKNSPSSTASIGPYLICDSCADRFGGSSSSDDDDDD